MQIPPEFAIKKEEKIQHNQICKVTANFNKSSFKLSVELVSWSDLLSGADRLYLIPLLMIVNKKLILYGEKE